MGTTLQVADKISARFAADKTPKPPDAKPFDINDYKQTVAEVAKTVNEANHLLETLQAEGLAKRGIEMQKLVDDGIDHVTWRAVQFAVFFHYVATIA